MQDRIEELFGHYRLAYFFGQGAFSNVYLGHHLYLNRQVVYHLGSESSIFTPRSCHLLRKAGTNTELSHPNIVRLLDFGIQKHVHLLFQAMNYAPYEPLCQHIPQGVVFSLQEVISCIRNELHLSCIMFVKNVLFTCRYHFQRY
ncbi:hypothetical protein [Ktedonospora formicarum]|uniref:Protein kinase domain-containing protein n=1 Tax=Ktedonospora formicarum TaxID=2778364 RepID=A0A8J3I4I2_9CHLR|nr:hypothetical protein [Ktedonospora formicarum]GHO48561.1 hypothetical protein KSX_67240 [Ktedonospora formicarum]